ncbi:MAG: hypothetical protein JWR48_7092 [Mycobacterium sp.]|jgi:hypothetical protein|nr:hypothetical protein [Mycobacterium sp.]
MGFSGPGWVQSGCALKQADDTLSTADEYDGIEYAACSLSRYVPTHFVIAKLADNLSRRAVFRSGTVGSRTHTFGESVCQC